MPGLFSRLKTWVSREVLTYSDLNAEFDNIISNCEADTLGGYSSTSAQMQLQVNPGTVGAESRPTNISGELERLRYVISRIVGKTYWYETPIQSLSQANADLSWYFPCNGNSASDVINNFATRGCRGLTKTVGFDSNGVINWTTCDIDAGSSAITSSNVVSYSGGTSKKYSLLNNGFIAVDGNSINANKGTLQIMFRNISAGDYLFHNKVLGIEVFANGSGNLVVRATSRAASSQTAKQTFSVTSATAVTGNVAFRQLFVDYVFNGAEGVGQDRLAFNLKSLSNTVVDSGSLTGQTITTNDDGLSDGIWYIGVRPQDPTWTGYSAMLVRPDAETVPWTRSSTGGDTVTNGVLRLTNSGAFSAQFSKAISPSFAAGSTFEWKVNLNSALETSGMEQGYGSGAFTVTLQDNTASRYFSIVCDRSSINVFVAPAGTAVVTVPVNASGPTVFRATVSSGANPTLTLYVNGACVAQYVNSTVNAGANSILFILGNNPAVVSSSIDCEYFAYSLGSLTAPLTSNLSGNIDEACLFSSRVSDSALISSLNSAPVSDVLKKDKTLGLRPIALQQAQIPGYTGSALASSSVMLGMVLGDGQTDVGIHGIGLFSINTLAAGSYRSIYLNYNQYGSNPPKYRIRDSIISEATSSYAMLNCRSMSGLSPVFLYSDSSNTAYTVGFSYASNGLVISTNQNRE